MSNAIGAARRPFKDLQGDAFPVRGGGRRPRRDHPAEAARSARTRSPSRAIEELRDLFRDLVYASDVRAVVLTGAGGNFSSGGDVFEIIEPLTKMAMPDLMAFTRMTGDLVRAMRDCPQTIIAAVDGICAGAGAILAMASDLRLTHAETQKRPSCSPGSAWPAPTWALAGSCRA